MKLRYRIADALGYQLVKKVKDHSCIESHIPKVLEGLEINCVVDVGANRGQYASMLRRLGYSGRIVSFEPVPAVYEKLVKRTQGDPNWFTLPFALGRVEEERVMYVYDRSEVSSLLPTTEYGHAAFNRNAGDLAEQKVSVRRLEDLWSQVIGDLDDPHVYLKMDTQGYDLEVFAGARSCLEVIRGLQSELSAKALYEGMPDYMTSLSEYRNCGFEVSGFFKIFHDKATHLLGEFDCVMIRPLPRSTSAIRP